jgi:ElaB protein
MVSEAYDRTTEVLSNTYDKTVSYGRENPGTMTLIAFGAGIGIGMVMAGAFSGRSRTSRIAEPLIGALSQVALEYLR